MNLHNIKPYGNLAYVRNSSDADFFEAVFFDMDGLLVDSEPLWFESESEVVADYGYAWGLEDQVACLGGPLSRVGLYMSERCAGAASAEFFTQRLIEVQTAKLSGQTPFMPGAIELVNQLQDQGVATGLVSASPRAMVDVVMANLGGSPFPFSISSDDVLRTKPHPDGYLLAAQKCNVDIEQCLIFEDSLTGVSAATASGAWLIAVPHMVDVPESARVRTIKSLEQLSFSGLQNLYMDFQSAI